MDRKSSGLVLYMRIRSIFRALLLLFCSSSASMVVVVAVVVISFRSYSAIYDVVEIAYGLRSYIIYLLNEIYSN